jgi:excinuclease ABC subunit A
VLDTTVDDALVLFKSHPQIQRALTTLADVGLGYIALGQSSPTLSGGEAQRVKLSRELSKRSTGRTLYILDEPTTGLHFEDIKKLLHVLDRLVEGGNTVVVIEHNLDVIKTADWIIDIGPDGGNGGGALVAEGTPEQVAETQGSHTGRFLGELLPKSRGRRRAAR